jgi:predicted ATPase
MLTRLHVQGFKSLYDVEVRFGPFTCIAGLNAAGKSNLFDAIRFLNLLTQKPIAEAVQQLRESKGRSPEPTELFTRFGDYVAPEIRLTADLVVDQQVQDDFGVKAKAAIATLRYTIAFRLSRSGPAMLELVEEKLEPVKLGEARHFLMFPHKKVFRDSVVAGRRSAPLISTSLEGDEPVITVHQEGHGGRQVPAPRSTRTVIGGLANADFPTVLAVHREMQSWRTLMLEPSAMRAPSLYRDDRQIDARGGNIPNAVFRLIKDEPQQGAVCAELANRLSNLVEDVRSLKVVDEERFETRTIEICGSDGAFHPARSLSDGTLRFLVLAVLDIDPAVRGLIALEEPENGIHPDRIPAIVQLLRDIAVDPQLPVGDDNPLRQIVINTHSPLVVQSVTPDDLVYLEPGHLRRNQSEGEVTMVYVPDKSWRAEKDPDHKPIARGKVLSYLGKPAAVAEQLSFNWPEMVDSAT